ncbi:hypothetical protein TrRE_jg9422, partial [Triparma retinervis]
VVEKKAPKAEFGNENYQDDQDDQDEQDEQDEQIKGTPAFSLPAIPNALVTPPEVGSEVVKYLLSQVSLHLGHTAVTTAVIAVPAKFNSKQREETAKAFKLAGLKVARVMDEPTAAALAYGLHRSPSVHHILVYDYGGGTLDVSVLHVSDGYVEVIGTEGDDRLGGGDFDHEIGEWIWGQVMGEDERVRSGRVSSCGFGGTTGVEWCTREDLKVMAERIKIEMTGIKKGEDRTTNPQTCMR